ncbi:MAG TPA: hypothetical protein VNV66_17555, partial [Pilimelia sp.]|nr:hypothetical protein [Pilimelia sp.]
MTLAALVASVTPLAGCADGTPAGAGTTAEPTAPATTPVPTGPAGARERLAAHAAAAKDRSLVAYYTLASPDLPERTVAVTLAADGSWRVDIPGGALGGTADVAVVRTGEGRFQCALGSAERGIPPTCVRVSGRDGRLPARVDPRVQHAFTDWREVLTDRREALAVSTTAPLAGVRGDCFAVESNSASLTAPLDVGVYCYAADGVLTGARLGFGTLTLREAPGPGPATVTLPGPVVGGPPLPTASPPPPTPTPSASSRAAC